MPQLDKVTLFSQVFWLLFLYFSFFLILLKYFLPTFSKLFKVRTHYILNKGYLESTSLTEVNKSSQISTLLIRLELQIRKSLTLLHSFHCSELTMYELSIFKEVNKLFILTFIKSCLNLNFYKKLYF